MNLDILFSGCPRNIVKQNDISILYIHGKENGNVLPQIYTIYYVSFFILIKRIFIY